MEKKHRLHITPAQIAALRQIEGANSNASKGLDIALEQLERIPQLETDKVGLQDTCGRQINSIRKLEKEKADWLLKKEKLIKLCYNWCIATKSVSCYAILVTALYLFTLYR